VSGVSLDCLSEAFWPTTNQIHVSNSVEQIIEIAAMKCIRKWPWIGFKALFQFIFWAKQQESENA